MQVLGLYRSMACFILQGSKTISIGRDLRHYGSAQYLISALDLPLSGQLFDAALGRPYAAVSLLLEPALLAELAEAIPAADESSSGASGVALNLMTAPLRDSLLRLLSLLDTSADIPVPAPMAERELLYRLLQGPQGRLLRQIARPEGALARIGKAAGWIRDHHNLKLRIEALCEASGMSRASLHRHFFALTGLTPRQYQKQLRLQEARRFLLDAQRSVSEVAFAVGYESPTQFSREYARMFGQSPARDILQIRREIDPRTAA